MSAYTTIDVSREKAVMYLIRRAMTMTNGQLESALDVALDERLYRARVSDERGADDDLLDYAG